MNKKSLITVTTACAAILGCTAAIANVSTTIGQVRIGANAMKILSTSDTSNARLVQTENKDGKASTSSSVQCGVVPINSDRNHGGYFNYGGGPGFSGCTYNIDRIRIPYKVHVSPIKTESYTLTILDPAADVPASTPSVDVPSCGGTITYNEQTQQLIYNPEGGKCIQGSSMRIK